MAVRFAVSAVAQFDHPIPIYDASASDRFQVVRFNQGKSGFGHAKGAAILAEPIFQFALLHERPEYGHQHARKKGREGKATLESL